MGAEGDIVGDLGSWMDRDHVQQMGGEAFKYLALGSHSRRVSVNKVCTVSASGYPRLPRTRLCSVDLPRILSKHFVAVMELIIPLTIPFLCLAPGPPLAQLPIN